VIDLHHCCSCSPACMLSYPTYFLHYKMSICIYTLFALPCLHVILAACLINELIFLIYTLMLSFVLLACCPNTYTHALHAQLCLARLLARCCVWPGCHPLSLCAAVLILAASLLCVAARANSLPSCCSSDCRVGTGLVMTTSGGLPYISKPASCWQHLPRPGEACC
jgi:hypothetical protein